MTTPELRLTQWLVWVALLSLVAMVGEWQRGGW